MTAEPPCSETAEDAAPAKRARSKGSRKAKRIVDFLTLIDAEFRKPVSLMENGKRRQVSTLEAIYHRLIREQLAGNQQAFRVRLLYDKFAKAFEPEKPLKIKIIQVPRPEQDHRDD